MNHLRVAAVTLAATGLTLLAPAAAFADPSGYGPSAPTGPSGTPGGFSTVVTAKTVSGLDGGTVTGTVSGADVTVTVPKGAFDADVQVEVTKPDLSAVTPDVVAGYGFANHTAVAGLGVKVLDDQGAPITGTFDKALTVTLSGSNLGTAGQKVLRLDGATSATVVDSTLAVNQVTFSLTEDPNLVVISPTGGGAAVGGGSVPGATDQKTGKPFTGVTVIALTLLAAGAAVGVGAVKTGRRRQDGPAAA